MGAPQCIYKLSAVKGNGKGIRRTQCIDNELFRVLAYRKGFEGGYGNVRYDFYV
jgi:hypothetical protein